MYIKYLGHSAFLINGEGLNALIDPFITGNPNCSIKIDDLTDISYIFVTHGHDDHIGDTVSIAKRNNSKVVTNFELGQFFINEGLLVETMHIGGRKNFEFGSVKMTPALHGSGIKHGDGFIYGGNPSGFLIETNGKKIYHAGDTGLTIDMQLLRDENIDVAMIPIGGTYTMDINDAVRAVHFIKPKAVIPMHYNTFSRINCNPEEFQQKIKNSKVEILSIGEQYKL